MGLIYLLAINGKPYIGQTKQTFEKRLKDHKKSSKNPNDKSYNVPLYRAIRKYGWETLIPEILENDIDDNELNDREIFYINLYNTMSPIGYNLTSGGNQMMICSDESREKMRLAAMERYKNPELHEKLSLAAKKRYADPEERRKASERLKARPISNPRKCTHTKDLPKYVSARRRASGFRYIIIDHPRCKFKYFGVHSTSESSSEISLNNCLEYLKKLDNGDEITDDSENESENESEENPVDVDISKVIKRKMFQKIN